MFSSKQSLQMLPVKIVCPKKSLPSLASLSKVKHISLLKFEKLCQFTGPALKFVSNGDHLHLILNKLNQFLLKISYQNAQKSLMVGAPPGSRWDSLRLSLKRPSRNCEISRIMTISINEFHISSCPKNVCKSAPVVPQSFLDYLDTEYTMQQYRAYRLHRLVLYYCSLQCTCDIRDCKPQALLLDAAIGSISFYN